ncbi:MAG TPA: glycosyltransferase [Chitinophagales bacterium]|nr:glycosyltransferase [Chitinophagales bacterium]
MSTDHNGQVEVANNVMVHNLRLDISTLDKLLLPLVMARSFFRNEIKALKSVYGRSLNLDLLKAIAAYAAKAVKVEKFLDKLLSSVDFTTHDVWVYSYWNFEYALASTLIKKKYPLKTVVRTHSLDLYFDRVPEHYHPFRRYVYLKSDLFAFISEQGRQYFFSQHHISKPFQQKGIVNRIGSQCALKPYKQNFNRVVVLSNAWIQPLKRIDLLIKALALINDIEIEWIHVGDDYGTGRFPALKALAEEYLGHKKNLSYEFLGRVTREELFELYPERKINLLINLSTTEGTPVSMMEALSFGVPVIGTSVGGVPEIIQDAENGFLLPVDINEQQVADSIRAWYNLPLARKEELVKQARKTWQEKFDADRNSAALIEKMLTL